MPLTVAQKMKNPINSVVLSIRNKLKLILVRIVKVYFPQLTRCGNTLRVS